ncbi:hypothetical protein [Agromyces allii]|uniref:Uncharacterized protein n=1 Tax=Agromyces allii TaxID=393607 RepID=A0ABN2Q4T5_9MICO|nr:hypothetical protein [Agromyces allii]
MQYTIDYSTAVWFPAPAEFPTAAFASEGDWLDAFVEEYERDLGELDETARETLREFAAFARAERSPLATEFLLFCPRSIPVLGIAAVHVAPSDPSTPLDLDGAVAIDDRAVLTPTVDDVHAKHLGAGRRAAVVVPSSAPGSVGGRINYAFEHAGCVVVVSASADRLPEASVLLPFVERLVDGIRIEETS